MQLAHAGDERLAGLGIAVDPEGGILVARGVQREPILSWSAVLFGSIATR